VVIIVLVALFFLHDGLRAAIPIAVMLAIGFFILRSTTSTKDVSANAEREKSPTYRLPNGVPILSKADYEYRKPFGGYYIAVHLAEQAFVIRGGARSRVKVDFSGAIPFADVRAVTTFSDNANWAGHAYGIELSIRDLDKPLLRVAMATEYQGEWIERIIQVCNMRRF